MIAAPEEKWEWTCGHVSGAFCAECFSILARRAHELAEECERLREQLAERDRKE